VDDPASATSADIAAGYLNLYDAWESCAADKETVRKMLAATKNRVKLSH